MEYQDIDRRAGNTVRMMCWLGLLMTAVGSLVSLLSGAGWIPAFLFRRSVYFSSLMRWYSIPVEFFLLCWFGTVCFRLRRRDRPTSGVVYGWVFLTAIPVAAVCVWLTVSTGLLNIPGALASAAGILTVYGSAMAAPFAIGTMFKSGVSAVRDSSTRFSAAVTVFGMVLASEIIRLPIQATSPAEAQALSFRTWYAHARNVGGRTNGDIDGLSVVVFTDYMCPYCASAVPSIEATVLRLASGRPLRPQLEIHDFPLDRECNPAISTSVHPGACVMAAAVRVVRLERGDAAAREFANWCYRGIGSHLGAPGVSARLDELGLAEAFHKRYTTVLAEVQADSQLGLRLGVDGTPGILLNGVALPGSQFFGDALAIERAAADRSDGARSRH